MRSLFIRVAVALERIADALEGLTVAPASEPEPTSVLCLHPAEARIDFGTTNGVEDWQCGLCGFRTLTEQAQET